MIYDVIIIGAGHNGLVTAALLARAGKKVLVLEKRAVVGGIAATEEIFPGFKFNISPYDAGLFLPELVKKLKPRSRELVELRYFKELSYEEIAAQLDIPLGTVKAQLFRAREFLHSVLKNIEGKI